MFNFSIFHPTSHQYQCSNKLWVLNICFLWGFNMF